MKIQYIEPYILREGYLVLIFQQHIENMIHNFINFDTLLKRQCRYVVRKMTCAGLSVSNV